MTERTLTELQSRLRYGDSNKSTVDGVKPQLILDILDSVVHKDDLDSLSVDDLVLTGDLTLDNAAAEDAQASGTHTLMIKDSTGTYYKILAVQVS